MLAGETRVKAQAAELEAAKAQGRELEQQLAAAQVSRGACVGPFMPVRATGAWRFNNCWSLQQPVRA